MGVPTPSDDIETMLGDIRASCEWQNEHDDILQRWRDARGEVGMEEWRWWWKLPDDELYRTDCDSREDAIAAALREEPGEPVIQLIEARSWSDDILAGDDDERFAVSRNHETYRTAANDMAEPRK